MKMTRKQAFSDYRATLRRGRCKMTPKGKTMIRLWQSHISIASACGLSTVEPEMINARKIADIDWVNWKPTERATLLFVIRDGRILLIHKKRGLGAGKINGPGGRLEPGETPLACAIREVQEELRINAKDVRWAGTLRFQFADGYSLHGEVFTAGDFEGTPTETDEAIPLWFKLDELPYGRMWADDKLWMPLMLAGRKFDGRFIFDGETMLDAEVTKEAGKP
jgi:8-oxo-dGTP diphosphatase